jgi:glycosyltransferase involved in cell wall biosynthesis
VRILLTSFALEDHTGGELHLRDLARAVRARGHEVAVYARFRGPLARDLAAEGFEVVETLKGTARPDVIHGQQQPALIAAMRAFPTTPAVHVVHNAETAMDAPLVYPRVLRHVAVDARCRRRIDASAAPAERRRTLLNFVDLDRFTPRPHLPREPRRALVFSNYAKTVRELDALREACEAGGITLDLVGKAAGALSTTPEAILGGYDIVFAKARAAIEAMAVGCAVVLCDFRGLGELVTAARFDHLRTWNFGAGVLTRAITAEAVSRELARYDAADAAAVSARIREEASLDHAAEAWLALYGEILSEPCPAETASDRRALARAARRWAPVTLAETLRRRTAPWRDAGSIGGKAYRLARAAWRRIGSPGAYFR